MRTLQKKPIFSDGDLGSKIIRERNKVVNGVRTNGLGRWGQTSKSKYIYHGFFPNGKRLLSLALVGELVPGGT